MKITKRKVGTAELQDALRKVIRCVVARNMCLEVRT